MCFKDVGGCTMRCSRIDGAVGRRDGPLYNILYMSHKRAGLACIGASGLDGLWLLP
jgi:hypothetical protein